MCKAQSLVNAHTHTPTRKEFFPSIAVVPDVPDVAWGWLAVLAA